MEINRRSLLAIWLETNKDDNFLRGCQSKLDPERLVIGLSHGQKIKLIKGNLDNYYFNTSIARATGVMCGSSFAQIC